MKKTTKLLSLITLLFTIHYSPFTINGQTTGPILRLNTEMHTAAIRRISTDADGKYILTASNDKTAKLWDAKTGELLQTFRPPIDLGNEGMLYAGALSPDGKIAAVGGWTGISGYDKNIYLFNTNTGELLKRLSGLGNVIRDLEFSKDGTYLAAALGGREGVVIYKKGYANDNDYSEYKTLSGYGDRSNNISFSPSGKLATLCYDGYIRLYNSDFNLKKKKTGAGNKPYSVAFSPDGDKIAVGYDDAKEIDVFDAGKLKLLYQPKLGDMDEEGGFNLGLTFSSDGNYLFGGGFYSKYINGKWWRFIRKWDNAGQGSYTDYPACGNTVMDIKPFSPSQGGPEGIIFAGSQPDFGHMNLNGNKIFYKAGETFDMRAKDRSHLKTNTNADKIAFKPLYKEALTFTLSDRQLTTSHQQYGLECYTDQKGNINISDWKNSYDPKLNGKSLSFLSNYERCRSVDIATYNDRIVFGAQWNIYCVNDNGEQLWETDAQSEVWAVNISQNGKVVIAALNGIINWYRMSDGELLLTLYVHPGDNKWVLYTPNGYYDASPGAEKYIGWHLNNGPDKEAYFFPASKFRNKYYRPDVIDNILVTYDEDEALRIADLAANRKSNETQITDMLPPVVTITSPYYKQEISSEKLRIRYTAKSPGGEAITSVKVMIDGRPVSTQRGFKPISGNTSEITIDMPPRDISLQLLAENRHGWSSPAEVRVKWKGSEISQEDILKPTLYILAIGVSDYQNDELDLQYASKDARDFTAAMQKQKGGLYKDVRVKLLTDAGATKNDILDGMDWIVKQTTSRDMAMIFIAGHGINDNMGTFYFLPYEADLESMRRSCLMFTEFKYTTSSVAGKVVAFVDACHSGGVMGSNRRAPDVNSLVNELSDVESGAVVFTSSTGKQYSLEDASWGNGAFTEALIEGLSGKADLFKKGKITVKTLDAYVAERVKELTKGQQTPTAVIPESIPDFPIGLVF